MDVTLRSGVRAGDGDRRAALALPGVAALLAAAAILQGAYWWGQLVLLAAGAVALWVVTAAHGGAPLVWRGLGLMGGGLLASAAATGWPSAARAPIATFVVAAAVYAVASRAAAADGPAPVLDAVAGVGALVGAIGLVGVAWHFEPFGLRADTWRLASTLTYQNAAASLLVLALPPAAVLAMTVPGRARRAMLVVIGIALAATLSRGGYLAAAVALGTCALLGGLRWRALVRPAAGIAVGIVAILPGTLGWGWSGPLCTVGMAAAIVLGSGEERPRAAWRVPAIAVAVGIVLAATVPATALGARFTLSGTDRGRVWGATVEQLDDHLLFGTGPGTYELIAPAGATLVSTRHAHNEYLEALSETGLIGLGALLGGIVLLGTGLWRARPGRQAGARMRWAACAASLAGFLVHGGFDFVWRVPVLVATAFVLLAVGTAREEGS